MEKGGHINYGRIRRMRASSTRGAYQKSGVRLRGDEIVSAKNPRLADDACRWDDCIIDFASNQSCNGGEVKR